MVFWIVFLNSFSGSFLGGLMCGNRALFCLVILVLSGCATPTYTTHYGVFEAENSAGELRQFRVYWQTARFEGWSEDQYRAFPVVLESQCSQRVLRFYDDSFGEALRCSDAKDRSGIHFCASARLDETRRGLALQDKVLCGVITDRNGSEHILDLEGTVLITLSCEPKVKERRAGNKKINTDFLQSSALPYIVSTRSVQGSDLEALLPEVSQHSSICNPEY